MNITIVQPNLVWEGKSRNLIKIEDLIAPLYNKTDIIVLPEMFNTGFSMNPEKLGEFTEGKTFSWMKDIARQGNFGLCGSLMIKENNNFYNRWVFVSPTKENWYYDKRHLFSLGGEAKLFSAGYERLVFNFKGIRINPYVCYDLRFPVWSRNRNDCDLIIYAANWPESRRDVWITLLKARAIENQCYVAGSNRIGTDGKGIKYCGDSMLIDPRGSIVTSCNTNEESSCTAEISVSELTDLRKKFPVHNDADDFNITF